MRIIAGRHRGRRLKSPKGKTTRPTSDAVREAIFNGLSHQVPSPIEEAVVLDLFAGSGALGLEALSRGARHVTFVDSDREAQAAIRENIELLGEGPRTRLLPVDFRRLPRAREPADLIFLDPPYGLGLLMAGVDYAAKNQWLGPDTLLVMEMAAADKSISDEAFHVLWRRTYGRTQIVLAKLTV